MAGTCRMRVEPHTQCHGQVTQISTEVEQKRAGEKGLLAGKTEIWLLSFAGGRQFVSKG